MKGLEYLNNHYTQIIVRTAHTLQKLNLDTISTGSFRRAQRSAMRRISATLTSPLQIKNQHLHYQTQKKPHPSTGSGAAF